MQTITTMLGALELKRDDLTHKIACQRLKKHDDAEAKQIALEDKLRKEQEDAMQRAIKHAAEERSILVAEFSSKNQKHQENVERIREKMRTEALEQFQKLQRTIREEDEHIAKKQRERAEARDQRLEQYWQKDQERLSRRIALDEQRTAEFERRVARLPRAASTSPTRSQSKNQQEPAPSRALTSMGVHSTTKQTAASKQPTHPGDDPVATSKTGTKKKKGVANYDIPRRGIELGEELDRVDSKHLKQAREEVERTRTKFIVKNGQREVECSEKLDRIRVKKLTSIEAMYAKSADADRRIVMLRELQRSQIDRSAQERDERAEEARARARRRQVDDKWIRRAQALVATATSSIGHQSSD